MLTKSKNFVTEINVSPDSYLCKSDHYLLNFEVKSNVKHNKVPKRKILNFKKANWEALIMNWVTYTALGCDTRLYGT